MHLVVIGASAGGIEALNQVIPVMPADLDAAVVVVVHMRADQPSLLPSLYQPKTRLHVKEVEDKDGLMPGTIYFAAPGYHVLVERDLTLSLSIDPPVHFCRPAIDLLFDSAADALGRRVIGVLLSGANDDGAIGLESIKSAGGFTIVQQPSLASSATMPQSAIDRCRPDRILAGSDIAGAIVTYIEDPTRAA
ncbi:chemotaxis protein CheB [soil metagenome]